MLPLVIGVVTSERGAVIQDIRTTILRRFPRRILLWPVPVQGQGAAEQIAAAIRGFGALPLGGPVPRPDVLIVARGGGSLEDLMAFNEEVVVRAAAASPIPLISAVGHETDTTLIDFASDRRAPTPTAAAEMAVPARADLLADLAQTAGAAAAAPARALLDRAAASVLLAAERGLPDLPGILGAMRQRLEDRGGAAGLRPAGAARRASAARWPASPPGCRTRASGIAARRAALALLDARARRRPGTAPVARAPRGARRWRASPPRRCRRWCGRSGRGWTGWRRGWRASPTRPCLARGFALVRDAEGAPLTTRRRRCRPGRG